jgi:hypothetical protein
VENLLPHLGWCCRLAYDRRTCSSPETVSPAIVNSFSSSVGDPHPLLRVLDPDPTLMSTTKLTGMENAATYVCCLAPDKENQIRILKVQVQF